MAHGAWEKEEMGRRQSRRCTRDEESWSQGVVGTDSLLYDNVVVVVVVVVVAHRGSRAMPFCLGPANDGWDYEHLRGLPTPTVVRVSRKARRCIPGRWQRHSRSGAVNGRVAEFRREGQDDRPAERRARQPE